MHELGDVDEQAERGGGPDDRDAEDLERSAVAKHQPHRGAIGGCCARPRDGRGESTKQHERDDGDDGDEHE